MTALLTEDDYLRAADALDCDVACIKAVAKVESAGAGFNGDGRPKILFEGHMFYKYTKGAYAAIRPDLCYPKWTKQFYAKDQAGEWIRFSEAAQLDRQAAIRATSWGKFQIMGENHAACGYASLESYVDAMKESEGKQLAAFVAFLKHEGLDAPLRNKQWAAFARGYNGARYALNQYDIKLAKAYQAFAG